jgi:dihydroneopterin aldolase / 2-amino-4-hydroxy-6-hydroxymethyldihydropteridine diphosphokinase
MADKLFIKNLLVRMIIGINDDERRNLQDVVINVAMDVDTRSAGVSDDIENSVNYRTVAKRIIQLAENSRFYLVEKLAQEIATLCLDNPRVQSVTLQVEKPNALRFAKSVGVEITRYRQPLAVRNLAYIGLGSNIDPEHYLRKAIECLRQEFTIWAISPVYESPALGSTGQANYLNAAALVETSLSPYELLLSLREIETELGRIRRQDRYAARTIDLDLVLYNYIVAEFDGHRIPDPTILTYPHLARTLADMAPGYLHPETGQPLAEIANNIHIANLVLRQDIVLR